MLEPSQAILPTIVGGLAVLTAVVTWVRWLRPRLRRVSSDFVAARDSIVGRPAIHDSITGREIEPALPGVGIRLEGLESAIQQLADSHVRLDNHEARIRRNEDDIKRLEAASVERVVARSESARAWAAMEAVALSTPDHVVNPDRADPPD